MDSDRIALQLYTVRDETAKDFLGTLERVAEMGYKAVEFAGYGDLPIANLRNSLDSLGLKAISSHVPYGDCVNDPQKVVSELQILGCPYAVVPAVHGDLLESVEGVHGLGRTLNAFGEQCREAGISFGYHNHSFEFKTLDGQTIYDILASATDPDLVHLELDVFWARTGGYDPVEVMNQYAGRMPLLHVKDMAEGDQPSDLPVGEGILPWRDIISTAEKNGTKYYITEQDNPRISLEDSRISLQNMLRMSY